MIDESMYHQYANWKLEYTDLLKFLKDNESILFDRMKHIIEVVDFMYDKLIDDVSFDDSDHEIFQVGFLYIFDQVDQINTILKETFKNDNKKILEYQTEINLLLNTVDFQNELLGFDEFEQEDMDSLINFEQEVLDIIKNKQTVSKEMFSDLDKITYNIFDKMNVDFYPLSDIFLDIADELGII
jgi:hypothetical protein